jgi:DTW domain-containing protein YfiP
VVVVRHASERGRLSNTGRLIGEALASATLLDYGAKGQTLELDRHVEKPAWLLFPEPNTAPGAERPTTLVVLDGTWPQARRMRQRIPELRGWPVLSLPGAAGSYLRAQRTSSELPTVLAVADALEFLSEPLAAQALRDSFQELRARLGALGRPSLRAFTITETEENAIAAPASIGDSKTPKRG